MTRAKLELSSTQIGALAESIVANELMIASGGRLTSFNPMADDDGIDILIYDKKTGEAIPLQIKSRTNTIAKPGKSERGNTVHFEIREAALKNKKRGYLLAVLFDPDLRGIERAWLIPLRSVPRIFSSIGKRKKFVMRANRSKETKDRYARYQHEDLHSVAKELISKFHAASHR